MHRKYVLWDSFACTVPWAVLQFRLQLLLINYHYVVSMYFIKCQLMLTCRRRLSCKDSLILEYSQLSVSYWRARLTTFMLCTDLMLRVLKAEISLCKLFMTSDGHIQARLSHSTCFPCMWSSFQAPSHACPPHNPSLSVTWAIGSICDPNAQFDVPYGIWRQVDVFHEFCLRVLSH